MKRNILTHLSLASEERDFGKQCGPRSDAAERGVWSGSTLFTLSTKLTGHPYCWKWTCQKHGVEEYTRHKWVKRNIESKTSISQTYTQLNCKMHFVNSHRTPSCYSEPSLQGQHFVPKNVAIKMNLLLYRILNKQIVRKVLFCSYFLIKSHQRGDSNKYPKHMFL